MSTTLALLVVLIVLVAVAMAASAPAAPPQPEKSSFTIRWAPGPPEVWRYPVESRALPSPLSEVGVDVGPLPAYGIDHPHAVSRDPVRWRVTGASPDDDTYGPDGLEIAGSPRVLWEPDHDTLVG